MLASLIQRIGRLLVVMGLALGLAGLPVPPAAQAAPQGGPIYVVDRTDDVIASACTGAANDCSLRGAIVAANSNPGAVIHTDAGSNYVLTNTAQGDLQALADMTIYPVGACALCFTIIQGGPGWNDRLMHVAVTATVVVSGMIWMNGNANNGGAFMNEGALDIHISLIMSNTSGGWGGGIYNEGGTLNLYNSFVSLNQATSTGGGIANQGGTVGIYNTIIDRNTANGTLVGQGRGGGLTNLNSVDQLTPGIMVLSNTTVLTNTTPITMGLGGGIMSGGHLTILNSTLRANVAHDGGGLLVSAGYLTMTATTVLSNTANAGGGGGLYNDGAALLTNGTWQGNAANTGGGILNNLGNMVVSDSIVLNNTTTGGGGGIRSGGSLELMDVTVQGNSDQSGSGGGIVTSSVLTVTNSLIHDNDGFQGGGIATSSLAARVTLDNTDVTSNSAIYGGGLAGFGTFTVTHDSQVNNNVGLVGGGANIFSTGRLSTSGAVTFMGNTTSGGSPGSATGAGIHNDGQVDLRETTLEGNQAFNGSGGALFNKAGAVALLEDVIVTDNSVSHDGGGLANAGTLTVTASAIISNTAAQAGGGITTTGILYVLNTTLSGNSSDAGGGGIWNGGTATVRHATVVGNAGNASGGGIRDTGVFTLNSSLLAFNTGATGDDCNGVFESATYNLVTDTDDCQIAGAGSLLGVSPLLSSLSLNSGTYVHELLYQSPGLDAADPNNCPATDQAGKSRPIYAGCDIGAFESLALAPFRLFLPLISR